MYSRAALDKFASGEEIQLQNRFLHQSRSTSSDSSAGRTSTPLLKYGGLADYHKTDPRLRLDAARSQNTNSAPSLESTSFNALRDRLIQQQWQFDQQQQWRIGHEPQGLGDFSRLPLGIRCQIYVACFPSECIDVELVEASQQGPLRDGLVSLMRSNRCIHDEVKPLIEKHMQSRLFNLVLSKQGVRFERNQYSVAFLTHEGLQRMTSTTIPSLDLFSRTRKNIRSLRLAIQIEPNRPAPTGLIPVLEPFVMWVFSLLATAETLQFMIVEFHLSHELVITELAHEDGSEVTVGELIRVLLGARAAAHCQRVMNEALTAELQVVRFVILQKDRDERQKERLLTSYRWNRPGQFQHTTPQHVSQQPVPQHVPQDVPQDIPQDIHQDVPQHAFKFLHQQPVYQQLTHHSAAQISSQPASHHARHAPPLASLQPTAQSADKRREIIPANDQILQQVSSVGKRKGSSGSLQIEKVPSDVPSRSMQNMQKPLESQGYSAPPLMIDSVPSQKTLNRRRTHDLKRGRKQERMPESHKKRKLDLGDQVSTPELLAFSSNPAALPEIPPILSRSTPGQKNHNLRTAWTEKPVKEEQYDVQSLRDIRTKNGIPQMKVKWHGYDQMTWEPRARLMEDVPEMVRAFDRRQLRAVERGLRAKIGQEPTTSPQETGKAAGILIQSPPEVIDAPETATVRMNQWTAQQGQSSLPTSSAQEKVRHTRAPKRPLTAYFLYMQATRPSIWDDLCKLMGDSDLVTVACIAKEGIRRWLGLEKEERETWDRIYAKRVAIYHIQMEAWKAGRPIPTQDEARTLVESGNKQNTIVDLT
jgi:hypothetical protein